MKKVALSALAAAMMSGVVYADTMTLYSDPKTGQVFTSPAAGRVEMGDFVDAKTVDMADRDQASKLAEYQDSMKKVVKTGNTGVTTELAGHKIQFSGESYVGLTSEHYGTNLANGSDTMTGFELRRNYVTAKAFVNDTDFFRTTLDMTRENGYDVNPYLATVNNGVSNGGGSALNVYVKYAYLYLDKVLPYTGVEIGMAHRPWIDYEEHNGWRYRSLNRTVLENQMAPINHTADLRTAGYQVAAPGIFPSADLGVDFNTKTDYFTSEIGLYNGEGYKNNQGVNNGLSGEMRLTAHLYGNGKRVGKYERTEETYANLSFSGLMNKDVSNTYETLNGITSNPNRKDRNGYMFHAVYNQPAFLIAASYADNSDNYNYSDSPAPTFKKVDYKTISINGEYRPIKDWTIIGRYDNLQTKYSAGSATTGLNSADAYNANHVGDASMYIYGVAYELNKNVTLIANGKTVKSKDTTIVNPLTGISSASGIEANNLFNKQSWMLTAEINW
ncbi:hypothetical protein [Sulfuricurvum sp.]|uniref:hypothetical protein n=1 Tax=Sulfuricurvum sp. TaxID=2025608 RepID=UPI003565E2C9